MQTDDVRHCDTQMDDAVDRRSYQLQFGKKRGNIFMQFSRREVAEMESVKILL